MSGWLMTGAVTVAIVLTTIARLDALGVVVRAMGQTAPIGIVTFFLHDGPRIFLFRLKERDGDKRNAEGRKAGGHIFS